MITIDNYYTIIKKQGISRKDLPPVLRKGWDAVNRVTRKGAQLENFWNNEIAKNTIALYFDELSEFIGNDSSNRKEVVSVPELKVSFNKNVAIDFPATISNSSDAAKLFREMFEEGEIELHEVMFVIYMNRRNEVLGYYRHSVGGVSGTYVDRKIILGVALKSLSSSIIMCHNHPSGNIEPSKSDKRMTEEIKEVAQLHEIALLDHIILTKSSHSSFADSGLMGVDGDYPIDINASTIIHEDEEMIRLKELEAQGLNIEQELLKL